MAKKRIKKEFGKSSSRFGAKEINTSRAKINSKLYLIILILSILVTVSPVLYLCAESSLCNTAEE